MNNAVIKCQAGSIQAFNETSPRLFAMQLEDHHQTEKAQKINLSTRNPKFTSFILPWKCVPNTVFKENVYALRTQFSIYVNMQSRHFHKTRDDTLLFILYLNNTSVTARFKLNEICKTSLRRHKTIPHCPSLLRLSRFSRRNKIELSTAHTNTAVPSSICGRK